MSEILKEINVTIIFKSGYRIDTKITNDEKELLFKGFNQAQNSYIDLASFTKSESPYIICDKYCFNFKDVVLIEFKEGGDI